MKCKAVTSVRVMLGAICVSSIVMVGLSGRLLWKQHQHVASQQQKILTLTRDLAEANADKRQLAMKPAPVCPDPPTQPKPVNTTGDVGHDTPVFSRDSAVLAGR